MNLKKYTPLLWLLFAWSALAENKLDDTAEEVEIKKVVIVGMRMPQSHFATVGDVFRAAGFDGGGRTPGGGQARAAPPSLDNSNKESEQQCKSTSNPVVIATGEKYKQERDFQAAGLYGLSLTRTYRSKQGQVGVFGRHWFSTLDGPRLTSGACGNTNPKWGCVPSSYTLTDEDGTSFVYNYHSPGPVEDDLVLKNTGKTAAPTATPGNPGRMPSWFNYRSADASVTGTLVDQRGQAKLITKNDLKYAFDEQGRASAIRDASDVVLRRYAYGPDVGGQPRLEAITSVGGQSVRLIWGAANRVATVQDSDGNIWGYQYDANGMLNKVTSPGDNPDIREYHYENANNTLLTGITIGGKRYSHYSYHPDGRVHTSALAGGEEMDTFNYGDKLTVISNAQGQEESHTFANVHGELKISAIARTGTPTCAGASASTTYDANGYLESTVDWNGGKTAYTYDNGGRLLAKTSAAGTSDAHTTSNAWNGDQVATTAFKDAAGNAYASVAYAYYQGGREKGQLAETRTTDLQTRKVRTSRYAYAFHGNGTLARAVSTMVLSGREIGSALDYDTAGNLIAVTDAMGHVARMADFTGLGQARTVIDANGVSTTYTYNPNGTLAARTESGNRVTRTTYNGDRQPVSISYPDGSVARYIYSASGRLESIGNALNEYATSHYDLAANTIRTSSARQVPVATAGGPVGTEGGEFSGSTLFDSLGQVYANVGTKSLSQ